MNTLNRLFGSAESIAEAGRRDEQVIEKDILKSWKEYLVTVPEKERIVEKLPSAFGERKSLLKELKELLTLKLADVFAAEKEEEDIVRNLHALEHDKKIKRVHRLEDCLRYYETEHEYIYELLKHLYSILKSEAGLVEKLTDNADLRKFRKLIRRLESDIAVEKTLIGKIDYMTTFKEIFPLLAKGEHLIHKMGQNERKLIRRMQKGFDDIFSGKKNDGITFVWAKTVFDAIECLFYELEAKELVTNHPDINFEIVNRPEFVTLVKETAKKLRKKDISEQMVNVFVHAFREWYNHERV